MKLYNITLEAESAAEVVLHGVGEIFDVREMDVPIFRQHIKRVFTQEISKILSGLHVKVHLDADCSTSKTSSPRTKFLAGDEGLMYFTGDGMADTICTCEKCLARATKEAIAMEDELLDV